MKKTHIPSLLAACLLVWSCSGPVAESTLRDVRSYIDEYPDSALAVLDTIPEGNLRGKKAEAEFALLYSMALDKNYIDMTDDSLINVAVRWYRRHGSADDRLKAWYYQGRVYQNAGDNERAMESFTRAERYVKRSGDCTTSGMLYSAKSRVYDYLFDIEKSSANLRRASEYYQLAKDTARYTGSILKLAGSSIVAEKTAEASAYLDTLGKYWDALSESKKSSCYSYMLELALIENRSCPKCGASYHVTFTPPKKEGICDLCGAELIQRADDKPETVKARLATYHEQTQPLIDFYKKEGILKEVDGTKAPSEVFKAITEAIA